MPLRQDYLTTDLPGPAWIAVPKISSVKWVEHGPGARGASEWMDGGSQRLQGTLIPARGLSGGLKGLAVVGESGLDFRSLRNAEPQFTPSRGMAVLMSQRTRH